MSGGEPSAYVAARRVLLDALTALGDHCDAVIVIGAQAVYLRTKHVHLAGVAPYTTDADLALDPRLIGTRPPLEDVLIAAGFSHDARHVGTWTRLIDIAGVDTPVDVDLLVPDGLVTVRSRRSAHLTGHEVTAARRTVGLEAVLVDNDVERVHALDAEDTRYVDIAVAGSAALIVAKLHKIAERSDSAQPNRLKDKDAADVYRLFQATPIDALVARFRVALASGIAAQVTTDALTHLNTLFGSRSGRGVSMAQRALRGAVPPATVATVANQIVARLLAELGGPT